MTVQEFLAKLLRLPTLREEADTATLLGELSGVTLPTGSAPKIKRVVRSSLGNITTTSTTRTAVDATNLPYQTFTLAVGDLVKLGFYATAANNTNNYGMWFDFEVDQPTSANVYVAVDNDFGINFLYASVAGVPVCVAAVATFIATEAGVHGFRPVWAAEGFTATLFNAASGGTDKQITFLAEHWPAALVG